MVTCLEVELEYLFDSTPLMFIYLVHGLFVQNTN